MKLHHVAYMADENIECTKKSPIYYRNRFQRVPGRDLKSLIEYSYIPPRYTYCMHMHT